MEGFIEVVGGKIWYEIEGDGPAFLLLHGGPGANSEYLKPLMRYAEQGFKVVRYDQLGSYRSDQPNDRSLWKFPRFVAEVETVRQALGLGMMHVLGQSWGSFLALEYALTFPDNLSSIILYSGAASTRQCFDGMLSLRDKLSAGDQETLARYEASSETDNPEYLAVIDMLMREHLCRLDPWPEALETSMEHMALPVYETMWGPNEFKCTGNLLEWDRINRLSEIQTPTLVLGGRHDEVVPACAKTMAAGIPNAELRIFEQSSHLAHFEEPDEFYPVLTAFLDQHR